MNVKASDLSLNAQAYQVIRDGIVRCDFEPGVRISERQLAERFALGKGPIRNALARLGQEGMVQPQQRSGYRVAPITLQSVRDNFQLRMILEPEAARIASERMTQQDYDRLIGFCGESTGSPTDDYEFLSLNKEFHTGIAALSGNAMLVSLIGQLLDSVERTLRIGLARGSFILDFQDEHIELLTLMAANKSDEAANLMRSQIQGGLEMAVTGLLGRGSGELTDSEVA